ncbi:MAG: penicillin-binding protein 2 [Thermacetogeniaceae bacterium]
MMVDRRLESKQKFFTWLTIAVFGVILFRLIALQLWEAPMYRTKAALNQFRFLPIRAPRGDIVDSKGAVLAANKIVNTISIVPQQTDPQQLALSVNNLVSLLHDVYPEIDVPYIQNLLAAQTDQSYQPVVIKRDVPMDVVERLEEHRQELPGVQIGKEIVRSYPEGSVAGHLLGYIGEVSSSDLEQHKDSNYKAGDLIGKFGLEAQYESYLRGRDGFQEVEVDVSGRPVPHANLITVPPQQGDRLVLTIDNDLQKVMETSMDNTLAQLRSQGYDARAGAAVALDVKTGAVLAMTSRPNFDPNNLVPPVGNATVREYLNPPAGTEPPMIDRAISSRYAPGSTFKPITGMAALTSGNITVNDTVNCTGQYWFPPYPTCWQVHGITNFFKAMAVSCDTYFYEAGRRAGAALIAQVAQEFGLDQPTGIDLPGEVTGVLSSPAKQKVEEDAKWRKWYQDHQAALDQKYNALLAAATTAQQKADLLAQQKSAQSSLDEDYRIKYNFYVNWQPFETFNMAIGQGANAFTPIELADYVAALANSGQRLRPYLVQRIEDRNGKVVAQFGPQVVHTAQVDSQVMATVRQALAGSTDPEGTSGLLFYNYPVKVAAKTGTAETGGTLNLTNGLFVAYAPADNPTIAFAGVIEIAHHGSDSAGLVGKAVFDQFFGLNKPAVVQQGAGSGSPAPAQPQPAVPQPAA